MLRLFATVLCLAVSLAALADARASFETKAEFALLMDAETKTVLFEKNADQLMAPASMSKMMTLALAFEALQAGRITLETEFTASEHAWRTGGGPSGTSAMFVPLNESVTVGELLQGIAVQSGNDASIIMAEGLAGTEEAFAKQMNDYAHRIGMQRSSFANATGLPNPKQVVTPRDLVRLAFHLIETYPDYYPYFKQREYRYRRHVFYNRNPLISADIGVDGVKTGYTEDSGYGLVASAVNAGQRLVLVINGLETQRDRRDEGVRLLNWGFRNFYKQRLFNAGEIVGDALVWGGEQHYVKLKAGRHIDILLSREEKQPKLRAEIVYYGPLKPPIKEGDQIAELRVITQGGVRNASPLFAAEDIGRGGILTRGFDSLLNLAFGWLL